MSAAKKAKDRGKKIPPDVLQFSCFDPSDPDVEFFVDQKRPIPTPARTEPTQHVQQHPKTFKLPPHYVKFQIETGAGLVTEYDRYDLSKEDMDWLAEYNSKSSSRAGQFSENQLESLIDCLEKESFKVTGHVIDPGSKFTLKMAEAVADEKLKMRGRFIEDVYQYWRSRRKKLQNALMRVFQQAPAVAGPFQAFVTRFHGQRKSTRRQHDAKTELARLKRMATFRVHLKKSIKILELVRMREQAKSDLSLFRAQQFDERIAASTFGRLLLSPSDGSAASSQLRSLLSSDLPKSAYVLRPPGEPLPMPVSQKHHAKPAPSSSSSSASASRPKKKQKATLSGYSYEEEGSPQADDHMAASPLPPVEEEVSESDTLDVAASSDDEDRLFYKQLDNFLRQNDMPVPSDFAAGAFALSAGHSLSPNVSATRSPVYGDALHGNGALGGAVPSWAPTAMDLTYNTAAPAAINLSSLSLNSSSNLSTPVSQPPAVSFHSVSGVTGTNYSPAQALLGNTPTNDAPLPRLASASPVNLPLKFEPGSTAPSPNGGTRAVPRGHEREHSDGAGGVIRGCQRMRLGRGGRLWFDCLTFPSVSGEGTKRSSRTARSVQAAIVTSDSDEPD